MRCAPPPRIALLALLLGAAACEGSPESDGIEPDMSSLSPVEEPAEYTSQGGRRGVPIPNNVNSTEDLTDDRRHDTPPVDDDVK